MLALTYFAKTEASLFSEMKQHAEKREDWFIAISSINVTSQLMTYLHLSTELVPLSHLKLTAARPQFKNFARLNSKEKRTFFELHNCSFRLLFAIWQRMVAQNGNSKLPPNFQLVINTTLTRMDRVLGAGQYGNVQEMKLAFDRDLFALRNE